MPNKRTHINIHHSAIFVSNIDEKQFEIINEAHRKRFGEGVKSQKGYYGGYHYLIERNGQVRQYRNDTEIGAHNNIEMMNFMALGVCFAGNMSEQELSDAQIRAGYKLIKELQEKYKIMEIHIQPHRAFKATQCPGTKWKDPVWKTLQDKYMMLETVIFPEDEPIVRWHKENKIIQQWSNPVTELERKIGWSIYKGLKALSEGKLKFNL